MDAADEIAAYNRHAWDQQVDQANRWTRPVSTEQIEAARQGDWQVVLTPEKPVPRAWFGELPGQRLLGLASGGGQQAPIFAAAGAEVTVLDNSPRQLEQDQIVARRDGLQINSHLGDMRDLSRFADDSFDLIFNPCSVSFIPEVQAVFEEAWRVLRPGGRLLCGFVNPACYLFDETRLQAGEFDVRHTLPYADTTHLSEAEQARLRDAHEPFCYSHSLETLLGGQLQAGFRLLDLYEDRPSDDPLSRFFPGYLATCAEKSDRLSPR